MIGKIKLLVILLVLPFFLVACSSGSGGGDSVLNLSSPVSGSVAEDGIVTYTLSVSAGNNYTITVDIISGDADLIVCLDRNCSSGILGISDYEGTVSESVNFTAPSTGTVYVIVEGWLASQYVITASQLTSTELTLSNPVSGTVSQNQVVPYTFSVVAGSTYNILLETTSGDADLVVCQQADCAAGYMNGSYNNGSADELINYSATYTGTLYISVVGFFTSTYTISVN